MENTKQVALQWIKDGKPCQAAWFYKSHKATANELIKHFQK